MKLRFLALCLIFGGLCKACYLMADDYDEMLTGLYSGTVELIDSDSLLKLLQDQKPMYLLDTRSQKEYEVSKIESAEFVNYATFNIKDFEKNHPKDSTVIVYCSVGYRSERVGEQLLEAGYENVYNLYGGIFKWKNNNYPIYNAQQEVTDSIHAYNKRWGRWLENGIKVYK